MHGAALAKTDFVAITSRLGIRGLYISEAPIYGHFKRRGVTVGLDLSAQRSRYRATCVM
jgi:hypothetical protein